jgi:hypothetical protein
MFEYLQIIHIYLKQAENHNYRTPSLYSRELCKHHFQRYTVSAADVFLVHSYGYCTQWWGYVLCLGVSCCLDTFESSVDIY